MKNKKIIALLAGLSTAGISAFIISMSALDWPGIARAEVTPGTVAIPAVIQPNVDKGSVKIDWTAPDQEAAKERAKEVVPFVETFIDECLLCRQQKLREQGLSTKDIPNTYFLLDSPIIEAQEDHYGPVRFMHAKHAAEAKDCAVCHHYRPTDPEALETTRCSACHQESFKKDHPERIGLKAAYHLQCMECHNEQNKGPVDCIGCHAKYTPDHKELVKLPENPAPEQVTDECLRCHKEAGEDMLTTAHWLWKGHSPYTMEHRKNIDHGKATSAFNNY
jgi:hypothetical protein